MVHEINLIRLIITDNKDENVILKSTDILLEMPYSYWTDVRSEHTTYMAKIMSNAPYGV